MRASVHFRPGLHYRRELFEGALTRLGYEVGAAHQRHPEPGDVIVLWNRSRSWEEIALNYERAGATVIIAENAYIARPGFHKQFALALGKHNGAGVYPQHDAARFEIPVQPWRETGEHVLVLPQRGIGSPQVAMPTGWAQHILRKLRTMTDRPIRVRRHPGLHNTRPLEDDLLNAWACVTWGSGAGIKALAAGIPVYYEMEHWIGADGAQPTRGADIEHPVMGNRQSMLSRVSWAQWAAEEIQSGEALAVLLSCEKQLSISLPEMPAPS